MNLIKRSSLSILFVFIVSSSIFSQPTGIDKEWDGGAMTNAWEDAANWNPDGVPTLVTDDVLISGAYTVIISSTSTIESLTMAGGASLTIAAPHTLTVAGNGNDGVELDDMGTALTVNGSLNSNNHGGTGIDINEDCSLTVAASGSITINNVEGNGIEFSQNIVNNGLILITDVTGKAGIEGKGTNDNITFTNNGFITISGGDSGIDLASDFLFNNYGTVTVSNAGALVDDGSDFINYGTFKGNGTVENGNNYDFSTEPGSTLAPGTSIGKLTFSNKVDFTGINLNIEINGVGTPGIDYDQIVVSSGGVILTGATLNLSGSYMPMSGDEFMILEKVSAGAITGTFSGLPSNFTISYTGGDGNDVTLSALGPLPVELIDFSAQTMQNEVKLTWATANEINNDFFTLERSPDGRTFVAIATITGNGTTTEISNYTFMDANPERGLNYYRLKQTDFDGQFSYSDLEIVEFGTDETIKIYPTVVENEITIETGGDLNGELKIIVKDLIGREYLSFTLPSKENKSTFLLNGLTPGSYFVIIFNNETMQTQKIIKL